MATEQTIPGVISETERTFHVDRLAPEGGDYLVRVYRETFTAIDGARIARREEMLVDRYVDLIRRVCFRDYLARCQAAKGGEDLLGAESRLYDGLVAEIRAERAAAAVAVAVTEEGA